jgi:lipoprotein-anchoring transpeptidase ErfK/SrfK
MRRSGHVLCAFMLCLAASRAQASPPLAATASLSAVGRLSVPGDPRATEEREQSGPLVVLSLGERRVYVMRTDDGSARAIESFPVAIGRAGYETPMGRFAVVEKIEDPDWLEFDWDDPSHVIRRIAPGPTNPLGKRWIGFATAHGWTIGFHGTPHPELLGQAVSHGCVRMRNSDVMELYRRVAIGTPVIVRE